MKKIALIGCGALGRIFAENLEKSLPTCKLQGVFARTRETAVQLAQDVGTQAYENLDALLSDKPDYVVELAGGGAVVAYGHEILRSGAHLIVVSVGALADAGLYASLQETAQESEAHIYIASGAIGGFDLMRTLSLMGDLDAAIDTQKAPHSLNGAPYLNGVDLPEDKETLVFDGTPQQAIAGFPKNVNVAVATSLAAGLDTRVTINSVPGMTTNRHTIRLHSENTQAEIAITSAPDPRNPKSSTMTAWSVIALLESLTATVRFF